MPASKYVLRYIKEMGYEAYRKMETERVKKYYEDNPEKKKLSNAKWDKKNRNAYQKKYNKKHGL